MRGGGDWLASERVIGLLVMLALALAVPVLGTMRGRLGLREWCTGLAGRLIDWQLAMLRRADALVDEGQARGHPRTSDVVVVGGLLLAFDVLKPVVRGLHGLVGVLRWPDRRL